MGKQKPTNFLVRLFQSPIFPEDPDKTRSALLLNVVINTFLIAFPVVFVGAILGGNVPALKMVLTIIASAWLTILGTKLIMLAGRVTEAGIVMVIILLAATTLAIYALGTIRAPATSFYLLAIVMAGLTISRRAIIWVVGISILAIITFFLAEKNGFLPPPALTITITQAITFTVVFTIVSILLYLAVKSIDEALARARQELADRRQAEGALYQFTERLEILHEIDRSLLSARSPHEIAMGAIVRIRTLIPCPRASVTLIDLHKHEAKFLAADFDNPKPIADTPIPLEEFGMNIIDELRLNKPWSTNEILEDPQVTDLSRRLAEEDGIHSWLCLPVMYQGQLIGSLNLGREAGCSFTTDDTIIAHDVANQLAIAIQHINLYNALQTELTERKKLISELEANNAELERFTYTVSHDLRNPLVTIKGFLGMLEKDLQDGRKDRIASDFQRIANAADKMDELLSDLLELSRIGRVINPPEEIDFGKLTHEAVELLDARIRSKHVTVNISPDLPIVFGDRIRLREVIENLIDNAVKYTNQQRNPVIEIGASRQKDDHVIFVRDNGMGIEDQHLKKIFGLFEKLNQSSEGTGIGLALIKRIIETHGGQIWAESDGLEKGSTFYFTIPENVK